MGPMSAVAQDNPTKPSTLMPYQLRAGQQHQAVNCNQQRNLALRVQLALDPWGRLRGLLGTKGLDPHSGLLLAPCRSIHTCFMRYAIDVLFLDRFGIVVALRTELPPWRFTPIFHSSYCVLELPAGTVSSTSTVRGHRVAFHRVE